MNERQNLRHSQSKVVCGNFLGLWPLTLKNSVSLTDGDVQTFSEGKKKPVYEKKTESYVFSGLNNSISRGRERKSATGRFAIWPICRLPKIFLLSVRTKSLNDNFAN